MVIIRELLNTLLPTTSSLALDILYTVIAIVGGTSIGTLTALSCFSISKKITAKTMSRNVNKELEEAPDAANLTITNEAKRTAMEIRGLIDEVDEMGNYACLRSQLFLIYLLLPLAGVPVCSFLLGPTSLIPFAIGYLIYALFAPRLEERRYILSRIETIVRKTCDQPQDVKRISKKFYKTFKNWIKPGRNNDDYFLTATTILKEYQNAVNP